MKRLDADCLHRDQLHPAIRDRLARIRELPHPRLAILRGVERFGEHAYLIWTFIDGTSWDQVDLPDRIWLDRAREIISSVDLLHTQGIVHGSLHAKNVIASTSGEIWLTDVSPYLYDDPIVDIDAVVALLRESIAESDDLGHVIKALERFDSTSQTLRDLPAAMTLSVEAAILPPRTHTSHRWRSVAAAVIVVILCIGLAALLRYRFR